MNSGSGKSAALGADSAFEKRLPIVSPEGLPGEEFVADVRQILQSRHLTNGAFVREFEAAAESFLGVPHCVAVSSCTSGLILVLQALGVRGEVILPSFTFHATAHSVLWNGLRPVFADCEPGTFCLDPAAVRAQLLANTAAILAVHLYGNPIAVTELEAIAAERGIPRSVTRRTPSEPNFAVRAWVLPARRRYSVSRQPSCWSPEKAAWFPPAIRSWRGVCVPPETTATLVHPILNSPD